VDRGEGGGVSRLSSLPPLDQRKEPLQTPSFRRCLHVQLQAISFCRCHILYCRHTHTRKRCCISFPLPSGARPPVKKKKSKKKSLCGLPPIPPPHTHTNTLKIHLVHAASEKISELETTKEEQRKERKWREGVSFSDKHGRALSSYVRKRSKTPTPPPPTTKKNQGEITAKKSV
jgi:hypothetical protein